MDNIGESIYGFGHHMYRSGHVDGVHCAGSVECHWRGGSVEAWESHRKEMAGN